MWIPAFAGMTVGAGMTGMTAQALKSPPFAKGGLGGFSPRLIPTTGRIQADVLAGNNPLHESSEWMQRFVMRGDGKSLQPPFCERGAFRGLRHHRPPFLNPTVIPSAVPSSRLPPSFPRKRESTPRPFRSSGPTGVLDSGLRRNDGGGGVGNGGRRFVMRGGGNPSNPPFAKAGLFKACAIIGRYSYHPHRHSGALRQAQDGIRNPGLPRSIDRAGVDPRFRGNDGGGGNDGGRGGNDGNDGASP